MDAVTLGAARGMTPVAGSVHRAGRGRLRRPPKRHPWDADGVDVTVPADRGADSTIVRSLPTVIAGCLLLLVTPALTWWIVGDSPERVQNPTYILRPINLSSSAERALGLGALVLWVGSLAVLLLASRRRLDVRTSAGLACFAVAGAILGGGYRVLTWGASGANLGGGLVVLFGVPLSLVLVTLGVALLVWGRRSNRAGLTTS